MRDYSELKRSDDHADLERLRRAEFDATMSAIKAMTAAIDAGNRLVRAIDGVDGTAKGFETGKLYDGSAHPGHESFASSVDRISIWALIGVASFGAAASFGLILLGEFGSDIMRWLS